MQNMLNTANSCRVYSLILEQNILVAVVLIFFHSGLLFSTPFVSTHSPIHNIFQKHILPLLLPPPYFHTGSKGISAAGPTGKGGLCPEGMFELHNVAKAEL